MSTKDIAATLIEVRHRLSEGDLATAATLLQTALTEADSPLLWSALAALRQQDNDLPGAEKAWREVLRHDADQPDAAHALGRLLLGQGRTQEALPLLQTAWRLSLQPDTGADLAQALSQMGRRKEAIATYYAVLKHAPLHLRATNNLALLLLPDEPAKALELLQRLISHHPQDAELQINLAYAHLENGDPQNAESAARAALSLSPGHPEALVNLGRSLLDQGRPEAAILPLESALEKRPDHPGARLNLGLALEQSKQLEAACTHYQIGWQQHHDPRFANNLARLHHHRGDSQAALLTLQKALRKHPENADLRYHLALTHLLRLELAAGWDHYRARPTLREPHAPPPLPAPLPEDLEGRRLLIVGEQGLGTELFFLRFAPELHRRGAHLIYRAGHKLISLLRRIKIVDQVIDITSPPPPHDLALAVGDLPLACAAFEPDDLPPPLPLHPDLERLAAMKKHLRRLGHPPYLGLTWRAGSNQGGTLKKEISLAQIAHLCQEWSGTLLVLQRAPSPEELARLSELTQRPIHDLSAINDDLEAALALLSLLEDYLCVSNTNLHLRAGLGRPCQALIPHPPDWRWPGSGHHSPWFPCVTVHHQCPDGTWKLPLEHLRKPPSHATQP